MVVSYSITVGYTRDTEAILLLTLLKSVVPLLKDLYVDVSDSYCCFELSGQLNLTTQLNKQSNIGFNIQNDLISSRM